MIRDKIAEYLNKDQSRRDGTDVFRPNDNCVTEIIQEIRRNFPEPPMPIGDSKSPQYNQAVGQRKYHQLVLEKLR